MFQERWWSVGHGRRIALGPRAVIMGILNVTPDSFSDGGLYARPEMALERALRMIDEGAAIVDIGGESTRPGASAVGGEEEADRVLPVIEALARRSDALISVDTYRSETARLAIAAGAHIVNDIWGLRRDPAIAVLAAETGAGLVIMHNSRDRKALPDPIDDQAEWFDGSIRTARAAGVGDDRIVVDPGFGFGKDAAEGFTLMARFGELSAIGFPLMAATSRKRFIGHATGRTDAAARDVGTAATSALLRAAGASVFRVHDVAINADALRVADAMIAHRRGA